MSINMPRPTARVETPLASILRPKTIDDVIGQQHLLGPGKPLRLMVEKDRFTSSIFWGPPGVGKTSTVRAMASTGGNRFVPLNATSAAVADIRKVFKNAEIDLKSGKKTLLFIDECLPYNTIVKCKIGDAVSEIPIGELVARRLDCEVLSYDVESGSAEWRRVISWSELKPRDMVEIEIEDCGRIITLRCSECHPIYTINRGWVPAVDLADGDQPVVYCENKLQEAHDHAKRLQDLQ